LTFDLHFPPEVLNAIVREEWDPFTGIYHVNVVKVVQSHFVITATTLTSPTGISATLQKDAYGTTDIVDIVTSSPCRIPGVYRIDYEVDCQPGMNCRQDSWTEHYIEFEIPDEDLCSEVSILEKPTMTLQMCADGEACTVETYDHILGYPILVKATLTHATTINSIDFYEVSFVNSAGVKTFAKNAFMQKPFGTFMDFDDHYPHVAQYATIEFTPYPDPGGDYEFWMTPDIHTPAEYTIFVTARANYALPEKRSMRLHSVHVMAADLPSSFGTGEKVFSLRAPPAEEEEGSSTVVVVVAVVAVVVVVAVAAVFFHLRRRTQNTEQKMTEMHTGV
jgi:hypothetical protein